MIHNKFSRYTKSGKGNSGLSKQEEKDAVKRMEAEALAIALGREPTKKVASGVSKQELAEVCRKGQVERDSMDIERVQGMGFGSTRASLVAGLSVPVKETLGATGSQQERRANPATPSNSNTEVQRIGRDEDYASDKIKKKKERKDKKSKEEKKHQKKKHGDEEKKSKKQRHNSGEDNHKYDKKSKQSRKRTHDCDVNQSNSKCVRHDSSSSISDSFEKRDKYSRRRHDSSDGDISRTTTARQRDREDTRSRQRRQRHDTE